MMALPNIRWVGHLLLLPPPPPPADLEWLRCQLQSQTSKKPDPSASVRTQPADSGSVRFMPGHPAITQSERLLLEE